MSNTNLKRCSMCKKLKPSEDFHRRYRKRGQTLSLSPQSYCKACSSCRNKARKIYFKKYREGHEKEVRERQWEYWNKNKDRLKEKARKRLQTIKDSWVSYFGGKCSKCGIGYDGTNACIFDFHHIKYISKPNNKRTGDETPTNLNFDFTNVVLLCANCHRVAHKCPMFRE